MNKSNASGYAVVLAVAVLAVFASLVHTAAQAQTAPSITADLQMAQGAAPFRRTADDFVARAMAGDGRATEAMLSRAMVGRIGEAGVRSALERQILPFFRSGSGPGASVTVARTTDANGQRGFAFYMWLDQRDAAPRPYAVYVVAEAGRLAVANVVPDHLVEGRHR